MHTPIHIRRTRGMSLVEVIVVSAIVGLLFGGLMASFQLSVALMSGTKQEAGALALAGERLEYIRSLPYNDVGTIGGIPEGVVTQTASQTLNGLVYNERVLIEYVDAPEDGVGEDDENGILADYKLAKVEYTWNYKGEERSRSVMSIIVPPGIETTVGGGTLVVHVFDAGVVPVADAAVRVVNTTGTTTIDTIRYTNDEGVAMFAGAPALAGYEIKVTKDGYSTTGTAAPSAENPNPSTPPVAVLESQTSTMNFEIDQLSVLAVTTVGVPQIESYDDTFDDGTGIENVSDTLVAGGAVVLESNEGLYEGSGIAYSVPVTPDAFDQWESAIASVDVPPDTSLLLRLYTKTSSTTYALLPDEDLPGNSAGFAATSIDLSSLTSAYPSLVLGATLASSNTTLTPSLLEWSLSYLTDQPIIPDVPLTLTGTKTIGTNGSSEPIPKHTFSFSTDEEGQYALNDVEWDSYTVSLGSTEYDIAEACGPIPYALAPNVDETLTLTLAESTNDSLRVRVENVEGMPMAGAEVALSRSGVDESATTSTCGGAFFGDLGAASDYEVEVTASGYASETATDVIVGGASALTIIIAP